MKNLYILIAVFALAAIGSHAAPFSDSNSASATMKVQDIDSPIRHPFEETAVLNCTTAACMLKFPAIIDTRVLLQHVSCAITLGASPSAAVARATIGDQQGNFNELPVSTTGASYESGQTFTVDAQVLMYFSKHTVPLIQVFQNGEPSIVCTLTGSYLS